MPNLDELFADIPSEGDPIESVFKDTETDTPSDSQPEEEPKGDKPVVGDDTPPPTEEDNVPFHKHPRWQQMQEKASKVDDLERELHELRENVTHREPSDQEVPESFQKLYGNDPVAYKAYREEQIRLKDELKRELFEEQEAATRAEREESEKWTNWVEDEFTRLQSDGKQFDRNELGKIMLDYAPTDANGNLDFDKGLALYETLKSAKTAPVNSTARKQLAAAATATTTGETPKKDYMTTEDLRSKSWSALR